MQTNDLPATPDLHCVLCGVQLKTPLILASGIWGTSAGLLARAARNGAAAVTSKSCGLEKRTGHPNPTVLDWGEGLINAVGLANPGVEEEIQILRQTKQLLRPLGAPLIASIFGKTAREFAEVADKIQGAGPDFIEANISCPNVEADLGLPFALEPSSAARVTEAIHRVTQIPLIVKLSPNTPYLSQVARAVENAGADAIAAVNTLGPGMIIDVRAGQPVLSNIVGGVSGPAIRPIAVRCVYEICQAVTIPVIGIGGIMRAEDVVQMIMAGATAVGLGSALHYRGEGAFSAITDELRHFMREQRYATLSEFRGIAHER